jgi:hypothetical protein
VELRLMNTFHCEDVRLPHYPACFYQKSERFIAEGKLKIFGYKINIKTVIVAHY